MSYGGLKRARSWKRRIQPKEAYSSPGLLYSESCDNCFRQLRPHRQLTVSYVIDNTLDCRDNEIWSFFLDLMTAAIGNDPSIVR